MFQAGVKYNSSWTFIYFVAYTFFTVLIVMNIVIGFVIDVSLAYLGMGKEHEKEEEKFK